MSDDLSDHYKNSDFREDSHCHLLFVLMIINYPMIFYNLGVDLLIINSMLI